VVDTDVRNHSFRQGDEEDLSEDMTLELRSHYSKGGDLMLG
jgi:hypothetical protein